jgi:hypothetical protein
MVAVLTAVSMKTAVETVNLYQSAWHYDPERQPSSFSTIIH